MIVLADMLLRLPVLFVFQFLLYGIVSVPANFPGIQVALRDINLAHQLCICLIAVFERHDTEPQSSKQVRRQRNECPERQNRNNLDLDFQG